MLNYQRVYIYIYIYIYIYYIYINLSFYIYYSSVTIVILYHCIPTINPSYWSYQLCELSHASHWPSVIFLGGVKGHDFHQRFDLLVLHHLLYLEDGG